MPDKNNISPVSQLAHKIRMSELHNGPNDGLVDASPKSNSQLVSEYSGAQSNLATNEELIGTVKNMINAGESDKNIALVIKSYIADNLYAEFGAQLVKPPTKMEIKKNYFESHPKIIEYGYVSIGFFVLILFIFFKQKSIKAKNKLASEMIAKGIDPSELYKTTFKIDYSKLPKDFPLILGFVLFSIGISYSIMQVSKIEFSALLMTFLGVSFLLYYYIQNRSKD